jgi:putative Mg2+ transporter-C (MgtC) family protein
MNHFGVDVESLVRVLVAIGLGAVVGFEREAADQAAGLRTRLPVALGACVFGIVSTPGFRAFEQTTATNVPVDVTRVASQVVVGIGFIGAGAIFRHGATVRNLTTAASLWVTAVIGLAAGIGDLGLAAIATVGLVASLAVLRLPRRWIRGHITKTVHEIHSGLQPGADAENVQHALGSLDGFEFKAVRTEKRNGQLGLRAVVETMPRAGWTDRLATIASRDDVRDLEPRDERELVADWRGPA